MGDGLLYVRDGERAMALSEGNLGGYDGRVAIPLFEDLVLEAAGECPRECIFVGD